MERRGGRKNGRDRRHRDRLTFAAFLGVATIATFPRAAAFQTSALMVRTAFRAPAPLCCVPPASRVTGDGATADPAVAREKAKEAFVVAARAGPKNGVGASPDQRAVIEGRLDELCALNPTPEPAVELLRPPFRFFDGTFALIYTNTAGGSSGKLGPFVGDVTQTFEGMRDLDDMGFSRRGIFSNAAQFGPLRTSLRARCERRSDSKLAITFEELSVSLFGVQVQSKQFEPGGKGTKGSWDLRYMDEDLRVLQTNAGNVLALEKVAPFGGESYMQRQKRIGSQPYEGESLGK